MKFFADTVDILEIKSLAVAGLLDGVPANPSLIAKSGCRFLIPKIHADHLQPSQRFAS
jgi:transaldolase